MTSFCSSLKTPSVCLGLLLCWTIPLLQSLWGLILSFSSFGISTSLHAIYSINIISSAPFVPLQFIIIPLPPLSASLSWLGSCQQLQTLFKQNKLIQILSEQRVYPIFNWLYYLIIFWILSTKANFIQCQFTNCPFIEQEEHCPLL